MAGYHGHMTMADGSHVPLTEVEAKSLWEAAQAAEEKSAADMPTSADALSILCRAKHRLEKLGWRDGIYCPKDGSPFAVIEFGSTGIFEGWYSGQWPTGHLHYGAGGTHPNGVMWKALADLTEAEEAKLHQCEADQSAYSERILHNFASTHALMQPEGER